LKKGVEREALQQVHAPIGLDLGAETPDEIALSIAAELQMWRRGGTGSPLRDQVGVLAQLLQSPDSVAGEPESDDSADGEESASPSPSASLALSDR
jgi:xanthine/CO dehydrogenase XdhC/CoxF family maturation factor